MKASELKIGDVIAITYGAMFPDTYVYIESENLAGEKAIGHNLETGKTVVVTKPSDYRSANGSPIGSWRKLSEDHAETIINELAA